MFYAAEWGVGIYSVDPDAQMVQLLVSYSQAWALAASNDPDMLYVSSFNGNLQSLSISTGVLTPIGGSFPTNSLGYNEDGFLYSGTWSDGGLDRIDPATGIATRVGTGSITSYAGDIVAGPNGGLFGLSSNNEIVSISPLDGSTSVLFNVDPTIDAWGISTTLDGRFWLSAGPDLYELNMTTGQTSYVMNLGFQAYDLASTPALNFTVPMLPTPGSLALFLGGALIASPRRKRPCIAPINRPSHS